MYGLKHDRPCTSPRRRQCRAGGIPKPPLGWCPSAGWFQWGLFAAVAKKPPLVRHSCR